MSRILSPEAKKKAAERAKKWRDENQEENRARERARYWKKKAENPELLKAKGRASAAAWRAKNPERDRQNQKSWYKNNPDKIRRAQVKHKYGITLEFWNELLASQNSACAICKVTEPKRGWALDHCHSTGKVRGILCHDCNTALGFMKDNPTTLRLAANYLER